MEYFVIMMAVSFIAGAMSYMIGRFWIVPIFRYHRIRQQLTSELDVCGKSDDEICKIVKDRAETHRRYSVNLSDIVYELPHWYKMVLNQRSEFPDKAVEDLMKLSNTSDPKHIRKRLEKLREALKLTFRKR